MSEHSGWESFQKHLREQTGHEVTIHMLGELQYTEFSAYPLKAYLFDDRGFHQGPLWLHKQEELEAFMGAHAAVWMQHGREVRITDGGDYLVYHIEKGEITYNGLKNIYEDL